MITVDIYLHFMVKNHIEKEGDAYLICTAPYCFSNSLVIAGITSVFLEMLLSKVNKSSPS